LPLPTGELVRIAEPQLGAQADPVEEVDDLLVEVLAARELLHAQGLPDDLAAGHARVERRVRILEHHVHVAAERAELPTRQMRDVVAFEPDRTVRRLEQAHDAVGNRALAAA
jgi:hypothetical protein